MGRPVGIIGLGNMGTALATALLDGGHPVAAWNRTPSRVEKIAARGAEAAASAADVVASCEPTLLCVLGHAAVAEIIEDPGFADAANGRTLIMLSNCTGEEAASTVAWAERVGAHLLYGTILSYPKAIGTDDATIMYFGAEKVYEQHASTLSALGQAVFGGAGVEIVGVLTSGLDAFIVGGIASLLQGAVIADRNGLDLHAYARAALASIPVLVQTLEELPDAFISRNHESGQATVDALLEAALQIHDEAVRLGISDGLTQGILDCYQRASDAGLGKCDSLAVIEAIENPALGR